MSSKDSKASPSTSLSSSYYASNLTLFSGIFEVAEERVCQEHNRIRESDESFKASFLAWLMNEKHTNVFLKS